MGLLDASTSTRERSSGISQEESLFPQLLFAVALGPSRGTLPVSLCPGNPYCLHGRLFSFLFAPML